MVLAVMTEDQVATATVEVAIEVVTVVSVKIN
jgi:hypothetical protein